MGIEHYMQVLLPAPMLSETQCQSMIADIAEALRRRHTHSKDRHTELDISEGTLAAQVSLVEAYANYRLNIGNTDLGRVLAAWEQLRDVASGRHSSEMLLREACAEVDARLVERQVA